MKKRHCESSASCRPMSATMLAYNCEDVGSVRRERIGLGTEPWRASHVGIAVVEERPVFEILYCLLSLIVVISDRFSSNGWWKTIANNNNKRKTEELGGARIKRRLPPEGNHRRENGREKRERKTEADDAGMDGWRIQRIKGKSTAQRRVASLEVGTCRRAENLKKKKYIHVMLIFPCVSVCFCEF